MSVSNTEGFFYFFGLVSLKVLDVETLLNCRRRVLPSSPDGWNHTDLEEDHDWRMTSCWL